MNSFATILGIDSARYVEMVDTLALTSHQALYAFAANEHFEQILRNDPAQGMQIFWSEILARAHLTAVTAILRNRRWISAIVTAAKDENLLAFAAALRGLIESAADASTALRSVARTLARDHAQIICALSGKLGQPLFLVAELEDQLIHFSYARHLTKTETATAPASHRARQIREYIEILEKGKVTKVVECYRRMCDLAHPGASSVWMWLHPRGELEIELAPNQEGSLIAQLLEEYQKTLMELLTFGFNPAIVTLRVIGYFPLEHLHVPAVVNWELSGIPLWRNCLVDLKGAPLRIRQSLRSVKPNHPLQPTSKNRRG